MKINPMTAFQSYGRISNLNKNHSRIKTSGAELKAVKENADQIQISPEGERNAEINRLVKMAAGSKENKRGVSPERIEKIREEVKNGSYYVPTDDLTKAFLDSWFGV